MNSIPTNLKQFDTKCCPTGTPNYFSNRPRITLSYRGSVAFSTAAASLLDLQPGDGVVFLQDQKYPSDWYVAKSDDPARFVVLAAGNKTLRFASEKLVQEIARSVEVEEYRFLSFSIIRTKSGYFALDVKHPKITPPQIQ